jgi:hypothetical protein
LSKQSIIPADGGGTRTDPCNLQKGQLSKAQNCDTLAPGFDQSTQQQQELQHVRSSSGSCTLYLWAMHATFGLPAGDSTTAALQQGTLFCFLLADYTINPSLGMGFVVLLLGLFTDPQTLSRLTLKKKGVYLGEQEDLCCISLSCIVGEIQAPSTSSERHSDELRHGDRAKEKFPSSLLPAWSAPPCASA